MSQHTPGPWELKEFEDTEGGNPWYRIEGKSTLHLEVVECSDGYVPGQNKANARLIAAAPDMLAMLKELEWSRVGHRCEICQNTKPWGHRADCAMVALIKRAEGVEP